MEPGVEIPPRGASEDAIQSHYDLSDDFYRLWLDDSQTYSCALWERSDSLYQAQIRKLDYHIDEALAARSHSVLDIGCGWGSLLRRLVGDRDVRRVTGLTLSQRQCNAIRQWADDNVDVRLESWAEHEPDSPYDAIISIGAFEHFARPTLSAREKMGAYRTFFGRCHRMLRPEGRLSLQTIVYENFDEASGNPFVEEVFPESDLPRLAEVVGAAEGLFEVVRVRNDREHYERTLRAWYRALTGNREAAVRLVGERAVMKYEKYLGIFIVGFHAGTVNLSRITLRRVDRPRVERSWD